MLITRKIRANCVQDLFRPTRDGLRKAVMIVQADRPYTSILSGLHFDLISAQVRNKKGDKYYFKGFSAAFVASET